MRDDFPYVAVLIVVFLFGAWLGGNVGIKVMEDEIDQIEKCMNLAGDEYMECFNLHEQEE